ncbi:MAG TPA: CsgG/HfaB family protein [Longimicrobiales bacterium]|nr:CsgG/HfaB family protein [Longimicrobiales bacterium]
MRSFDVLAVAGVLAVSAASAAGQQVPTVGVMDLNAFSVTLEDAGALGRGLAAMITTELAQRAEVRIVDRQQLEEVLRRHQVSVGATGVGDDAAMQIGRLLGANYMVTGNAALDPRQARLDLRMIEVETGAIVKSVKETGARDDLLELAERIAALLVTDLRLPDRPSVVAQRIPVSASLAYSRGLDYELRGRADRAAEMYRRTLEVFPQHPHAQAALDRVQ